MDVDLGSETEALKAIFEADFEDLPPQWGCPSFRVRVWPAASQIGAKFVSAKGKDYYIY